ncbi:MAG TPA: ATP synthase F1 subunit delta [Gemmatimonadales bacterium]|nr:ATP synthase F1 subunit delta [Gemmatimonadales bacterium]
MRAPTIARNYAEALFELGEKSGRGGEYLDLLEALAAAIEASPRVQAVLMSPKVTKARKAELLAASVPGAPRELVLFIQAVVKRGRQLLFGEIANQYADLLDIKYNRVRAGITLARQPDPSLKQAIVGALAAALDKEVVAAWVVEPQILGGAVIRVGDRVLDGSVRRRMKQLRRQLLSR